MASERVGLWFVGAKGGVAATSIVGLVALSKKLIDTTGLVTELPLFAGVDCADWSSFVVGGHEIRDVSMFDAAMQMHTQSRAIDHRLIENCKAELDQIDARIRPGVLYNVGNTIEKLATRPHGGATAETPRDAIRRIQDDLKSFAKANNLARVVVVNVASTEPPIPLSRIPATWAELDATLDRADCPLPSSSLYAIATLDLGMTHVNFTPSLGSIPPAIDELARLRKACHMGCDGKTGETLLKSVLAPMFARRNLHVMSWVGHNIFGNMDGQVLNDPINKATKVVSKDRLLHKIFGYEPQTLVSIEYIESLGDWKTAWDHIHFRGFLGTPMSMQFTWQGCDSLLAAPLVLDLARLAELATRRGEVGELTFLASFFKSPQGVEEHDFVRQYQMLEAWALGKKMR